MAPMSSMSPNSGHLKSFSKASVEQSFNPLEWTYIELIDKFASVCTVIAVCIAGYQIIQHLRHFNEPQVQLQVIRILFIIPVSSRSLQNSIYGRSFLLQRIVFLPLGVLNLDLVLHYAPEAYLGRQYHP